MAFAGFDWHPLVGCRRFIPSDLEEIGLMRIPKSAPGAMSGARCSWGGWMIDYLCDAFLGLYGFIPVPHRGRDRLVSYLGDRARHR
jgi:hypothetical protein